MIKVRLYGLLAEMAGTAELEIPAQPDSEHLFQTLVDLYPGFQSANPVLAVNRQIIHQNQALQATDEVALLPPFSGG